jgi:hypothetical protein
LTLDHGQEFTLPAMTELLHIAATPGAPIACDMSTATDTPEERRAAYDRLFARALISRDERDDGVVFRLRAGDGTRAALEDLVRREAECCPFADYRLEAVGDELIWTITAEARDFLDAFLSA